MRGHAGRAAPHGTPPAIVSLIMDQPAVPPDEPFVPIIVSPGRRPSLAELAAWHEALQGAVATSLPLDLLALWIHPSRGGTLLVGPTALGADHLAAPAAEPLIAQEGLFRLEDRVRSSGYQSVMAVAVRDEVQDVGLLLTASLAADAYRLVDHRTLHRIAAALAPTCRRLAAAAWIVPSPAVEERTALIAGVAEGLLDAMARGREGPEVVQLASDALANQLPHDRLVLVAVAPAPDCWALVGAPRGTSQRHLSADIVDSIDAIVHGLGSASLARIPDLHALGHRWPTDVESRTTGRVRSVLAARLELGGEMVGWLWLGSEATDWFRAEDELAAQFAARLLAAPVAAWAARAELAGVWG